MEQGGVRELSKARIECQVGTWLPYSPVANCPLPLTPKSNPGCLLASPARFVCPPNRPFRCKNDRVCLWIGRQCDGTDNCGDGTDEEDCGELRAVKGAVPGAHVPAKLKTGSCLGRGKPLGRRVSEASWGPPSLSLRSSPDTPSSARSLWEEG